MFARFATVALLALSTFSGFTRAEPVPTAAPALKRDIFDDIASAASNAFATVTAGAGGVASYVTSVGGQGITIISAEGGSVYTLATNGVGQVTSIAGSEYTIATNNVAEFTSSAGAAYSSYSQSAAGGYNNGAQARLSFPITLSLVGTVAGVAMGAAFVL
ncbi:hypothetical protein FRC17_006382 [Serendipita sp. 399]|nr:hypothetical protein FRC17_006382 [Serendipita sp. 399]